MCLNSEVFTDIVAFIIVVIIHFMVNVLVYHDVSEMMVQIRHINLDLRRRHVLCSYSSNVLTSLS